MFCSDAQERVLEILFGKNGHADSEAPHNARISEAHESPALRNPYFRQETPAPRRMARRTFAGAREALEEIRGLQDEIF